MGAIAAHGDSTRICGFAAMYAMLRVAEPGAGRLLAYEQSLVSDDDLSQVKKAFDLNGWVGIVYFLSTAVSLYLA